MSADGTDPRAGTKAARSRAVKAHRGRVAATGRRVDLMLPEAAARALERLAKPEETATGTIVRVLLHAAGEVA